MLTNLPEQQQILRSTCKSILLAAAFAGVAPFSGALAGPITFAGIAMEANGSAALVGSTLRLTPALGSQTGSAFTSPFAINGATDFATAFQFRIHGGTIADGFTFTVHNAPAGQDALGGGGGSMGYAGITPSIAVEFDTFQNGGEFVPGIGINQNGSLSSLPATAVVNLREASLFAWVDYEGSTNLLEVFFSTTSAKPAAALLSTPYDLATLGSQAFFGFTAATGGSTDNHDIEAWTLSVTPLNGPDPGPGPGPGLPEPGTLSLLAAGLLWLGGLAILRRRKPA